MRLIKRILLPFYPDSSYLQTKWWHRLGITFAVVWSFVAAIILLITTLFIGQYTANYFLTPPDPRLEITDKETGEMKTITYEELGKIAKQRFPQYNDIANETLGRKIFEKHDKEMESILNDKFDQVISFGRSRKQWYQSISEILPFWILSIVLFSFPTVAYRTILYVAFGSKWKK